MLCAQQSNQWFVIRLDVKASSQDIVTNHYAYLIPNASFSIWVYQTQIGMCMPQVSMIKEKVSQSYVLMKYTTIIPIYHYGVT